MEAIIRAKINEIENKEHVRILFAAEGGSRAWGLASPESDYDVRFIYVRQAKEYLRLEEFRDTIDAHQDDILDMDGWDLRKALRFLYRSTPEIHEWFRSSIVYRETEEAKRMRALLPEYFSTKKCANHYIHMAAMNFRTYFQDDEVWLVKYFYLLRPLLLAKWLTESQETPPMLFSDLAEHTLDDQWKDYVFSLLEQKKKLLDMGKARKNKQFNKYLEELIHSLEEQILSKKEEKKFTWGALDDYFFEVLRSDYSLNGMID